MREMLRKTKTREDNVIMDGLEDIFKFIYEESCTE